MTATFICAGGRKFLYLLILALTGFIAGCSGERDISAIAVPHAADSTDNKPDIVVLNMPTLAVPRAADSTDNKPDIVVLNMPTLSVPHAADSTDNKPDIVVLNMPTLSVPHAADSTDNKPDIVVLNLTAQHTDLGVIPLTLAAPPNTRSVVIIDTHGRHHTIRLQAHQYADNLGAFVFTLNTQPSLTPSIQREIVAQINIPNAIRSMIDLTHYRRFITHDENGNIVTLDLAMQNYDADIISVLITLDDINNKAGVFDFVIDGGRTVFTDIHGQIITLSAAITITINQSIDFMPIIVQHTAITATAITSTIIISDPNEADNPAHIAGHTLTIRQTIALGEPIPAESLHFSIASIKIDATLTVIGGEEWDTPEDFHLPPGKEFTTVTIITTENIRTTLTTIVDIHYITVAGDGMPSDLVVLSFISQTGEVLQITVSRHLLPAELQTLPAITVVLRGEDNTILGTLTLAATSTATITINTNEYYYDAALTIAEITVYDGYSWAILTTETIHHFFNVTVSRLNMTVGIFAESGLPAFAVLPPPNPSDGKNYRTAEFAYGTGLDNIKADAAYQRGYFGQGVTVAIIDSGLLTTHLEFAGRIVPGYDFVLSVSSMTDHNGHGSHVAGIIGGAMDGERFHGVAPSVHIMPLRIFGSYEEGPSGTNAQVLSAMELAISRGVQVINNSWGEAINVEGRWKDSSPFDPKYVITMPVLTVFMSDGFFNFYGNYFNQVKRLMTDADVIQVFAAGNEGWNSDTGLVRVRPKYYSGDYFAYGDSYPISVDEIINNFISDDYGAFADLAGLDKNGTSADASLPRNYSSLIGKWLAVVATDDNDRIAYFSNGCGAAKYWCLAAPGVDIWSASALTITAVSSRFGTSFAAPHVSGALALLISRLPQMPKPVIKAILLATATDLGETGVDDVYGHGLVNVEAAITVQGSVGLVMGECSRCRKPTKLPSKPTFILPPPNPSDGKNYRTAEFLYNWGLASIKADAAYQRGYFGQGVIVAVLDTGVLTSHIEFGDRIVPGRDFIYRSALIDDDVGHGTHVAGIIGGAMNGTLFHGVAPSVYIMPLAFLNSEMEEENKIPSAHPYDGMEFAIENGASIINNSWGTSHLINFYEGIVRYQVYTPHLYDNVVDPSTYRNLMASADVIQVFSAGNGGWNAETGMVRFCEGVYDTYGIGRGTCHGTLHEQKLQDFIAEFSGTSPKYINSQIINATLNRPQAFALLPLHEESLADKWLAVVATDDNNIIASFSNGCGLAKYWCLAAPGVGIWSAVSYNKDGNYYAPNITTAVDRYRGTSMAAPHVSGALALLLSRLPHIPMPVLKAILLATATDLGAPGVDDIYGHGLVNIAAAITVQGEITLADDDANDDDSALPGRAVDNAHKRMRLSRTMAHLSHQMSNLSVAFNFMDDYYFGASYQSFITPQQAAAPLLGNAAADLLTDHRAEVNMLDASKLPTFFAATDHENFLYYGAETQQWRFRYDLCEDCGHHQWTPSNTDTFAKPFFANQQAAASFTWQGSGGWSPFAAIDAKGDTYRQFGLQWHGIYADAQWGAEISHITEQGKVLGSDFGDGYFAVLEDGQSAQMKAFVRRELWDGWSGFAEYQWGRANNVQGALLIKHLSALRFDGWRLGLSGKSALLDGDRLRLSATQQTALRGTMQAHHCSSTTPILVEDLKYHLDSDYDCKIVNVNIDAPRHMIYALGYELPTRHNLRAAIGLEYSDSDNTDELAASFALRWAL